jgi:GT2 family glycosyltransferase
MGGHHATTGHNDRKSQLRRREFAPIAVLDLELSGPLRAIPPNDASGLRYGGARVLVRLHGRPLGALNLEIGDDGVSASECATAIWSTFERRINNHMRVDGLGEIAALTANGLPTNKTPPCLRRRETMMRDGPLASVIICTRNRPQVVMRTLRSLKRLEYPRFEVLLMDGSSSTDTVDIVRADFPEIHYCHVGDVGKSGALNAGIALASGEMLAFTDDDVVVDRHWLAELVGALTTDHRVACVTGLASPLELTTQAQLWFEETGGFTGGYDERILDLESPERGLLLPYATERIGAGVNMAWRRDVIRRLGGFDVALDSAEDLAAFFDALIQGFKIVYEPAAIVYHEHRRTYEELRRQSYWHGLGLGAYLMRCIVTQPAMTPGFVKRLPRGLYYGFNATRNREKPDAYPPGLTRVMWLGVLLGPFTYLTALAKAGLQTRDKTARSERMWLARAKRP